MLRQRIIMHVTKQKSRQNRLTGCRLNLSQTNDFLNKHFIQIIKSCIYTRTNL